MAAPAAGTAGPRSGLASDDVAAGAAALACAERERLPIPPLTERWPHLTVADAYAIQRHNADRRLAAGTELRGHKVGLTSAAMQALAGVDEPDFGHLFSDMVLGNGAELMLDELIVPRAEPEIAFVLSRRLQGPGVTLEDVLGSTAYVLPALEIIDSRISNWRLTLPDTVADSASSALVVLGEDWGRVEHFDLARLEAILLVDGVEVHRGFGEAVLDHPAAAVAWLVNRLAQFDVGIEAGHLVLPGSFTAAVDLAPGMLVEVDFPGLGSARATCR